MNLSQLIKQIDDLESNAPSFKRYISESVYRSPEMTKHWRKLDEGFFKGYDQYLKEVALTPDQIQNIFKQAGQQGAGADAAPAAQEPQASTDAAPAQQPAGSEPPATPAAEKQSKVGVGQINKVIPTLRVRDLKSVQKNVDTALQTRTKTPQPTAESVFYSRFLGKEI